MTNKIKPYAVFPVTLRMTGVIATTVLAVLLTASTATAQMQWLNTTGSPAPWYDEGGNWDTGFPPGAGDVAQFFSSGSYEVWWDTTTAGLTPEVGAFQILAGDITFLNQDGLAQHEYRVVGSGAVSTISGGSVSLTISGLHVNQTNAYLEILNGARLDIDGSDAVGSRFTIGSPFGLTLNGDLGVLSGGIMSGTTTSLATETSSNAFGFVDSGSLWQNSGDFVLAEKGLADMFIAGTLTSANSVIGFDSTSQGNAFIDGGGAFWNNSGNLTVARNSGNGTLSIQHGAVVTSVNGTIGQNLGSSGDVFVIDPDSQWNMSGQLVVGQFGNGVMTIENGGRVSSAGGTIGESDFSNGQVSVFGSGSRWFNTGNLSVRNGSLTISNSGDVTSSGTTTIGSSGVVYLEGGRFDFGQATIQSLNRVVATDGIMLGTVFHSGYTDVSTLGVFQNPDVDQTGIMLVNSGVLYGDASLGTSLTNSAAGEVNTVAGERMRFAGLTNSNVGEINNFGGQIRFDGGLDNAGFVGGRGQFIADGGWTNSGVMAFSGGFSDVLGDILVGQGGSIVTSGGGTTTIFDDLVHEGAEIRTAASSITAILGAATGSGAYTGTGTVFFEGDLRPGSSPAIVSFEGSVVLGAAANTVIEIYGIDPGEFDQLSIAGNLDLDGDLFVEFGQGFQLGYNQEFLIADVGGVQTGFFDNFGEGAVIGNFQGVDLFITYSPGGGNGILLFSAVPEPAGLGVLCVLLGAICCRRRRCG